VVICFNAKIEKEKKLMNTKDIEIILSVGLILISVSALVFYEVFIGIPAYQQSLIPTPIGTWAYTTGLSVTFGLSDFATGLPVSTVTTQFLPISSTPLALVPSTATSVGSASYSLAYGTWVWTGASMGTYGLLVQNGTSASHVGSVYYPILVTMSVPGTNITNTLTGQAMVTPTPSTVAVIPRASVTFSALASAYNSVTHLYENASTAMNYTNNNQWQLALSIGVGGLNTKLLAGKIYLPIVTGLSIQSVFVDNLQVSPIADMTGTTTGQTGYAISFTDWLGGTSHTINIVLIKTTTITASTYPIVLFDDEVCANAYYRWWTNPTPSSPITLTA